MLFRLLLNTLRYAALGGYAIASTARRLNDQHIAWLHLGLTDVAQHEARTIHVLNPIAARLSGLAACHAKGATVAIIGEDGYRHRLQEADDTCAPVAPMPTALTARLWPDLVAFQAHREAPFEHLRVRES